MKMGEMKMFGLTNMDLNTMATMLISENCRRGDT